MKPRVLVLADVPTWAWGRKALAYQHHLADQFDITVGYHTAPPRFDAFDLVHLFEVLQVGALTPYGPHRAFKAVAGLTAHVWRTWGTARMRAWAAQVDALHGNSLLLVKDLQPFHERVYYTPNGVEPLVYQRRVERGASVVFGHVGKPNPRKGGDLIVTAAREAGVELRLIQRTSKLALSEAEMVDWYQGISVMVCASNMDGTPNPLLEGAACGCALLSTPIGNMPEFIERWQNGYLTVATLPHRWPDDIPQMSDEVYQVQRELLAQELSLTMRSMAKNPGHTRQMGHAARQTVLNGWTWAHQVHHVATMWREVLGA
jgi:glycosyltransferase involved in cell wall biosynthesis